MDVKGAIMLYRVGIVRQCRLNNFLRLVRPDQGVAHSMPNQGIVFPALKSAVSTHLRNVQVEHAAVRHDPTAPRAHARRGWRVHQTFCGAIALLLCRHREQVEYAASFANPATVADACLAIELSVQTAVGRKWRA